MRASGSSKGSGGWSEAHSLVCAHADRGARAAPATARMMPERGAVPARTPGQRRQGDILVETRALAIVLVVFKSDYLFIKV